MSAAVSLDEVLARSDIWRGDRFVSAKLPAVSSGYASLDAELPGAGWTRGALTEILSDSPGLGECSLLLPALMRRQEEGKWLMLVAPPYQPHAPAWCAAGINLARLVIVSPKSARDALWVAEQALASGALGTVLLWAKRMDSRQVRRLQVAAAGSDTLGFLFRPANAERASSAASLRLLLDQGPGGKLRVNLLKRRGPPCHRTLHLDVPRPVQWRDGHEFFRHEPTLASTPFSLPAARSADPAAIA